MVASKSRTNRWELPGASFCSLVAGKGGVFSEPFLPDIGEAKMAKNEESAASIRAQEEGP